VRAGARSQGGTVKVAAAGGHSTNPAAAAALGLDAPTVAAAVAAAAPAAKEELHSDTAFIQRHVRALLAGEVADRLFCLAANALCIASATLLPRLTEVHCSSVGVGYL
jgi:hypothetical protein